MSESELLATENRKMQHNTARGPASGECITARAVESFVDEELSGLSGLSLSLKPTSSAQLNLSEITKSQYLYIRVARIA